MGSGNWLKQNFEGGKPRPGWEKKPVTYVSLEDAREYCAFEKKRLPHVCASLQRSFSCPLVEFLRVD